MIISRLTMLLIALSAASCADKPETPYGTRECMEYFHMSTAPLPPAVVEELKAKCNESGKLVE